MAAKVKTVTVASTAELQQEVRNHIAQGYVVASQTDEMATLEFRVRTNLPLLFLLLALCIVPGLVYLFRVGAKAGRQVVIIVDAAAASPAPEGEVGTSGAVAEG